MRTIKTYSKRAPFYNAFVGTIQMSELIPSGLPVIQQLSRQNTLSLTI
jgi:hypothetical protein